MTLLAATDFTLSARTACRAAARLATILRTPLHLVHVAHLPGTSQGTRMTPFTLSAEDLERRRKVLETLAVELRGLGADVKTAVVEGLPDEAILEQARAVEAQYVVIGPEGDRKHAGWNLGSVAIRVVKSAPIPVLVVREEQSLERWATRAGPLRTLVGLDGSRLTHAALGWLRAWQEAGPLDLLAVHVQEADGDALATVDLAEMVRGITAGDPRVLTIPCTDTVAELLAATARSERTELLVVGTHRRGGLERLVRGSVSLEAVAAAPCNVVTVPLTQETALLAAPDAVDCVLVAYDGSEFARTAIPWACALVSDEGEVVIVQALVQHGMAVQSAAAAPLGDPTEAELGRIRKQIEEETAEHVPAATRDRRVSVRVELERGMDPARAIVAAARRLDVDAICLATHGRSAVVRAVLGSVAQAVVRRSPVPVVLVPPPRA